MGGTLVAIERMSAGRVRAHRYVARGVFVDIVLIVIDVVVDSALIGYGGIAATLRTWHVEIPTEEVGLVLLLTGAGVVQRAHAMDTGGSSREGCWYSKTW